MGTNFISKLEIYNFIIDDLFIWNQVAVLEFCLKLSNGKMTRIKDVGPDEEIYNFVVDSFFH
jgi:hypothetical protein